MSAAKAEVDRLTQELLKKRISKALPKTNQLIAEFEDDANLTYVEYLKQHSDLL